MTETSPPRGTIVAGAGTLCSYIEDHLAGATAGVRLFEAARSSWSGTEYEAVFRRLATEIAGERQEVAGLLASLGYRPGVVKMTLAHLASLLSRVNPVNLARAKRTSGSQLELETLQSALRGKQCLWDTLLLLQEAKPDAVPMRRDRLQTLLDHARRQQDEVAEVMRATAVGRFLDTRR